MTKRQIKTKYRSVVSLQKIVESLIKDKDLKPSLGDTLLQLRKDIKSALSFWEHRKAGKENYLQPASNKLQIGGGKRYLKGFVNLDLFKPADIIWDCRYGLPFPDNKFKLVFSEHFLEHIDFPISVKFVLREMHRVLKPNGELLIGVPDGGKVIEAYCKKDKKFMNMLQRRAYKRQPPIEIYGRIDLVNYLFRDQSNNPDYTIHHWAYDESSLRNLLSFIGFRKVLRWKFDSRYCNPKRKFYTLYIKAVK